MGFMLARLSKSAALRKQPGGMGSGTSKPEPTSSLAAATPTVSSIVPASPSPPQHARENFDAATAAVKRPPARSFDDDAALDIYNQTGDICLELVVQDVEAVRNAMEKQRATLASNMLQNMLDGDGQDQYDAGGWCFPKPIPPVQRNGEWVVS